MDNAGITAQYGFLFQRKAFILHALENAHTKQVFTFEGKDDIDVTTEESLCLYQELNVRYIQVKSGHVDETCFSKVICNWLLLDADVDAPLQLICEHPLEFSLDDALVQKITDYILDGKNKKRTAIARKIYDSLASTIEANVDEVHTQIRNLFSRVTIDVCVMLRLDSRLEEVFFSTYCSDIHEYELAKEKRLNRLISYINEEIDIAIKAKKPYELHYPNLMRLIMKVAEEISDHCYSINILELKKQSLEDAKRIVTEKLKREVKQLFLVNRQEAFVIDGIVQELMYKDFRDVFVENRAVEISNIEQNAFENYSSAKFSLDDSELADPKKIYNQTVRLPIESNLIPPGIIYRKGCYIYMTGDNIDPDSQITWGEDND